MRIALMVIRLIFIVPVILIKLTSLAKKKAYDEGYRAIKKYCIKANKAGRVKIECYGKENIPKENGFIFFPNHQGLFDVLAMFETCDNPFSIVYKKEVGNVILLKQVFGAVNAIAIDRNDLRQSLQVIHEMTDRVLKGENFVIFAEGTRSRMGNVMNPMKPGSFKSAVKAKCPIVPVMLYDSFKPFDRASIKKVTVKIRYLTPMTYEEYKDMSTTEIAEEVKKRIEAAIAEFDAGN